MADLPITFSGPMVRAILREIAQPGTGKTQTRRVINPQPKLSSHHEPVRVEHRGGKRWVWMVHTDRPTYQFATGDWNSRYVPGDRLYVREHWRVEAQLDPIAPRDMEPQRVAYIADETPGYILRTGRFRQAMHMPKWASRITLLVTDVRVERLQDCSVRDAIAEGIEGNEFEGWRDYSDGPKPCDFVVDPRRSYATLWDSINGEGAWEENPWVVAYTFKPILGHIDQAGIERIIHGDATGADALADRWARAHGIDVAAYPVTDEDWETFGTFAGPRRNKAMLIEQPDVLVAFPTPGAKNKGTKSMMRIARAAGVQVVEIA
eukprot:jgi/Tetstr1/441008/TSEL_029276.t1